MKRPQIILLLLYSSIIFDYFISQGTFVLLLISIVTGLIIINGRLPYRKFLKFISPILIILLIGSLNPHFDELYLYFKDVYYHLRIILFIYFGYILASYTSESTIGLLTVIAYGLGSLAFYHVFQVACRPDLVLSGNSLLFRQEVNSGINGISLLLLLIIILKKVHKHKNNFLLNTILLSCIVSIVFAFSRTIHLEVFILILILLMNRFIKLFRTIFIVGIITLISIVFGFIEYDTTTTNVHSTNIEDGMLMWKYSRVLDEIKFQDYEGIGNRLQHLRGYEGHSVLEDFKESDQLSNWLFGFGFGSYLDWSEMYTNMLYKNPKISLFHNGFLTFFYKTGFLGVFFYLVIIFNFFFSTYFRTVDNRIFLLLSTFLGAQIFINTFVVMGLMGVHAMFPSLLTIGVLIRKFKA